MPRIRDLTGQRFGRLTVISLHPQRTKAGMTRWNCRCDCGNETIVAICNIGKNTNSCGCLHFVQHKISGKKMPLQRKWGGMIERCHNQNNKVYKDYGARGITVCDRWRTFLNFQADMLPSYFPGATIERIDNNLGYSPENCRWADRKEQSRNRRRGVLIDTPWGRMNVAEAAERLGIPRGRFSSRVRRGWTTEQLFDPKNAGAMTKWNRRKGHG